MRCSCCGEEVGSVSKCPICGSEIAPKTVSAVEPAVKETHITGADIFEQNVNGVVELSVRSGLAFFSGSGYLINSQGYAITNSHVVVEEGKLCDQCTAIIAGERIEAQVVAIGTKSDFCSNNDLAIIKLKRVPVKAKPLRFADSSKVRTGEQIYIIGNSLGEGTCITAGIISDNDRRGQFMYDSATNGGNSGGPVFNQDGHVIATHVKGKRDKEGAKAQGMNGGIPCIYAKRMLDENYIRYESD